MAKAFPDTVRAPLCERADPGLPEAWRLTLLFARARLDYAEANALRRRVDGVFTS